MSSDLVAQPDQVKLFHLYVLFGGNAARAAAVGGVDASVVESLAHDHNWKAKLNTGNNLLTDDGKEAERELNRVGNYVLASRLQKIFEILIDDLGADEVFVRAFCTETDKDGNKSFNTKNLVELAKGLQIVSDIKYRALGDKLAAAADTSGGMQGTSQIAINIYGALAKRFDRLPPVAEVSSRIVEAVTTPADAKSS